MKTLKSFDPWLKYGIIFSAVYCILALLFLAGSFFGIAGRGEHDLFGWLLIILVFPISLVLSVAGFKFAISTSLYLLLVLNIFVFFSIGSLLGLLISKLKGS